MSDLFCCSSINPYRLRILDHEAKFRAFKVWADLQTTSRISTDDCSAVDSASYAVQLVRQINYGAQESIRYFVLAGEDSDFMETTEGSLLKSNFNKLNSYMTINDPDVLELCADTPIDTRISDVKSITNSSKSTCIRRTRSMPIIGGPPSPDHPEILTWHFDGSEM